jgi:hypothetical protein
VSFTPQDVINEVRRAVQDTKIPIRYSDEHVLGLVNQSIRRTSLLRPDLFSLITDFACVAGTVQRAPADSMRIMEIIMNGVGSANVNEVNRDALDLMFSSWQSLPQAPTTNWMRHPRNPNAFFVYPPSPDGQVLVIEYAQSPKNYGSSEVIELLPDAYLPCLVDCTVWLLESIDNEHVNNGRAQMFQQAFMQGLGLTVQTKVVTDTEAGGIPKDQVV